MKRIVTTAAIVVALALPAFAEGDDSSAKAGDAKSTVKSDTNMNAEQPGGTMGRTRATTGSSTVPASAQQKELEKSKNTSGADGSSGSGGSSGGPGGSGK
jgi:hypothetical protein